jgi:hypothetical protein
MSGSPVDLGHEKLVFDFGNALSLNVSAPEPTKTPAAQRAVASRDQAEEFLASGKPRSA